MYCWHCALSYRNFVEPSIFVAFINFSHRQATHRPSQPTSRTSFKIPLVQQSFYLSWSVGSAFNSMCWVFSVDVQCLRYCIVAPRSDLDRLSHLSQGIFLVSFSFSCEMCFICGKMSVVSFFEFPETLVCSCICIFCVVFPYDFPETVSLSFRPKLVQKLTLTFSRLMHTHYLTHFVFYSTFLCLTHFWHSPLK